MLLSPDGTLLVQMLNFVAFWLLLNALFIAPTRRAIEARQRIIAEHRRATDEANAKAAGMAAKAAAILDDARRRTDEIIREGAANASAAAKDIERLALEEAAATVALAQARVAAEHADATAKQDVFVGELARAMASRALSMDGEDAA